MWTTTASGTARGSSNTRLPVQRHARVDAGTHDHGRLRTSSSVPAHVAGACAHTAPKEETALRQSEGLGTEGDLAAEDSLQQCVEESDEELDDAGGLEGELEAGCRADTRATLAWPYAAFSSFKAKGRLRCMSV